MRIVIVNSSFSVSQEPRTIGEQADKNTREMGTYELQERREADRKEREELFGKPHEPWYGKMSKEKQKEIFDEPDKKKRKKKINDYVIEGK